MSDRYYNDTPRVSVTVPLYNSSKYLRECLDSLASQTLKNVEIILVDDGSTDGSGEICDEYCKKYANFRVIHQKNSGSASARQVGLDASRGEYVIVCDSDDWVEPNMYEKLYRAAIETEADIVTCNYFAEYNNGRSIPNVIKFTENDGVVDNRNLLLTRPAASWVKLIRKSLFERSKASYELGINLGEDALIMFKLMLANPRVVQINDILYHYRRLQGENTYTNAITMNHVYQMNRIYEWLKSNPIYSRDEEFMFNRVINLIFATLRTKDLDKIYLSRLLSHELSWEMIISNKKSIKSIFVASCKIFPISFSKLMIKYLYPLMYK